MTQYQMEDLKYYNDEARKHLFSGNMKEAIGCYILGRDLAGLNVHEQTRKDFLNMKR